MTLYYRDFFEHVDLEISDKTFLYLIQIENEQTPFVLSAMQNEHLRFCVFDPWTRAAQYWPVSLEAVRDVVQDEHLKSRLFNVEHNPTKWVLSHMPLSINDVRELLKIEPHLGFNFNKNNVSYHTNHIKPISFKHCSTNNDFISFARSIAPVFVSEMNMLFDEMKALMDDAVYTDSQCQTAAAEQKNELIIRLHSIKLDCDNIRYEMSEWHRNFCALWFIFPAGVGDDDMVYMNIIKQYSETTCNQLKDRCEHYAQLESSNKQDHSCSSGMSVISSSCMSFFNNASPKTGEVIYPYNRTRIRL